MKGVDAIPTGCAFGSQVVRGIILNSTAILCRVPMPETGDDKLTKLLVGVTFAESGEAIFYGNKRVQVFKRLPQVSLLGVDPSYSSTIGGELVVASVSADGLAHLRLTGLAFICNFGEAPSLRVPAHFVTSNKLGCYSPMRKIDNGRRNMVTDFYITIKHYTNDSLVAEV